MSTLSLDFIPEEEKIVETIDVIRQMCSSSGMSLSQLENELGYGNGSIAKAKNMSADRIYQIAKFFGVSMEYLMTGKTLEDTDSELALLRQQQSVLIEMNKVNNEMKEYYKKLADCQTKLTELKKEYSKIENKKKGINEGTNDTTEANETNINNPLQLPDWMIPDTDDPLPFN